MYAYVNVNILISGCDDFTKPWLINFLVEIIIDNNWQFLFASIKRICLTALAGLKWTQNNGEVKGTHGRSEREICTSWEVILEPSSVQTIVCTGKYNLFGCVTTAKGWEKTETATFKWEVG